MTRPDLVGIEWSAFRLGRKYDTCSVVSVGGETDKDTLGASKWYDIFVYFVI